MESIIDKLQRINTEQSTAYVQAESARKRYWAQHPTHFACIKCMDGRVLFPSMTGTPIGIVKPLRAIGGKFHIWWPSFLGRVRAWVEKAQTRGCKNFIFVTYHFSASDTHLGCAGWKYETVKARAHAEKLQKDLSFVFGEQLTAIVTGVETDRDNLILHFSQGDISGESLINKTADEMIDAVIKAEPHIDRDILRDLLPFLQGNAAHVDTLIHTPRETNEKGHNERVIALGQGFDWLASANVALIINDADPNLASSVAVAASIIEKNLAEITDPADTAVLLTCIPYRDQGMDYRQAVARAKGLKEFAWQVINEAKPDLVAQKKLTAVAAVLFEPNKKMEILDDGK